jgi:hypothetical protein
MNKTAHLGALGRAAVATVLLIGLGACATDGGRRSSTAQASTVASSTAAPVRVTVTRSGGFAGVQQRVVIEPDGRWIRAGGSADTPIGQLSADQIAQLQRLAHEPVVAATGAPPSRNPRCADGYVYTVSIGAATTAYTDCGGARPEIPAQIVALVTSWILNA